jgi:DNA-binding transcriptional MerR regulator
MNASNKYQYNIGAVARLTQIHPETIRVWERRYQLVVPERSDTGRRMYSNEDIGRLLLVKQLTELGNAVSGLANLSNEELRNRLTTSQSKEINTQPHTNSWTNL